MKRFAIALALLVSAAELHAAARLTYVMHDTPRPLQWGASAFPLTYVVSGDAIRTIPDAQKAVDAGFRSWEIANSRIAFTSAPAAELNAGRDGRNAVALNDELFEVSGFIAYTTTWFDESSGELQEVDIQLDPRAIAGNDNVDSIIRHEVGHLLGFDHSGIVSAAMFPFLSRNDPVVLDSDDRIAASTVYGAGGEGASVSGRVDNGIGGVFGAHVVAVDVQGRPVASTLTDADGSFAFKGIPAGSYTLIAEPLDGPVEVTNLSGYWRGSAKPFRTELTPASESVALRSGESRDGIMLRVGELPVNVNPRWLGTFAPGASEIPLSSTMQKVRAGQKIAIAVGGDGIISGLTTFDIPNTGFRRTSAFNYGNNYLWAEFEISAQAPPDSVVVVLRTGDEVGTLAGALAVEASQSGQPRQRASRP